MFAEPVTLRGQSKPSDELACFIELVNAEQLYEKNHHLPDINEFVKQDKEGLIVDCSSLTKALKPATRDFLGPTSDLQQFRERYHDLETAAEVLVGIAAQYGIERKDYEDDRFGFSDVPIQSRLYNNNGIIAASGIIQNVFVGVRADRIRSCAVCSQLFWAPRVNSECCQERCRKTFNKRQSRAAVARMPKKRTKGR
jgi:hypothetical protein